MTVQILKLADCITLTKGKPPAEMPYFGDDAEPYLSPEYLRGKGVAEPAKPAANSVRVKDGDTVLLWDGSNAGEVFRARAGLLASTMTLISHGKEFEPEYFCYAAKRWEGYLKGQTSGSGIPHVDKEVLGKLEILKLPPDEQKLIAHILTQFDITIEQTEALIAKHQCIKTGLMQDLLTNGIDESGNIRSEATHAFKDSPLGRIPVEWTPSFLGKAYSEPPRNGIYKPLAQIGEGVILVGQTSFTEERLINYSQTRRTQASQNEIRAYGLRVDDILVSRVFATVEGVGLPTFVHEVPELAVYESNMLRIRIDRKLAHPLFINYWLLSEPVRKRIASSVNASNQASINQQALADLPLPIPPLKEQERILMCLENARAVKARLKSNLVKALALGVGLANDLLTGKVRVDNLLVQAAAP